MRGKKPSTICGVWRSGLLGAASIVLSLGLAEASLRVLIALGASVVRRPGLYADAQSDDDYWKLWNLWWTPAAEAPRVGTLDPLLGWAPVRTAENPLGIVGQECAR